MADVILFGAEAAAEVATVYLDAYSEHRVIGFTVDAAYCKRDEFMGRPVVPWEDLERSFPPERVSLLGPISFRRMNQLRRDRYVEGKKRGYRFISFVHPQVERTGAHIGENCFVGAGVLIEPGARLGDDVMVWSNAHIGHHTAVRDHCFIGPGAGVGGLCTIGEFCFIGPRADVMPGIRLGRACFLGAGAVAREDVPDETVFLGAETSPKARYPSSRLARHV
jgi:sugar O-acyltransferase (sialic acid O-acetyltransferase NeuD family)